MENKTKELLNFINYNIIEIIDKIKEKDDSVVTIVDTTTDDLNQSVCAIQISTYTFYNYPVGQTPKGQKNYLQKDIMESAIVFLYTEDVTEDFFVEGSSPAQEIEVDGVKISYIRYNL